MCRRYKEAEHALFLEYTDLKGPLDRTQACQIMQYYLQQLNLDISKRKYVHVTGSKGKGSTCSYVEAALRKHGLKTGGRRVETVMSRIVHLSPHSEHVREILHQRRPHFKRNLFEAPRQGVVPITGDQTAAEQ